MTHTRLDLSYTVQSLSKFLQAPRQPHVTALDHTLRYLAHIEGQGILLKALDNICLQAFSDSDWAARRSVTCYVLLLVVHLFKSLFRWREGVESRLHQYVKVKKIVFT